MTITNSAKDIFIDAHQLYEAAIERLDAGDFRDAAEKAWCATLRATDACILARMDLEPEKSSHTSSRLKELSRADGRVRDLGILGRYYHIQGSLHGDCFYHGKFDEEDVTLLYSVKDYIKDVATIANS